MNSEKEEYNSLVAQHYSAYRPPLHDTILSRVLDPDESFELGLDIGCGTGCSTLALSKRCKNTIGIDNSLSMLKEAQNKNGIKYIHGSGDDLSAVPNQKADIVTMAGVLFYIKNQALRDELKRISHSESLIIVYDFEVLFESQISAMGILTSIDPSTYKHEENLSDWDEFETEKSVKEQLKLKISSLQYAHIILSNTDRFKKCVSRFKKSNPFNALIEYLDSKSSTHTVATNIFFSRYSKR